MVANQYPDGSIWALHVSDREGLLPHGWNRILADGSRLRDRVGELAQEPWTAAALMMRDAGVVYLYVSDTVPAGFEGTRLHRTDLDADPRFEPVLVGATATLYVIHWDGD